MLVGEPTVPDTVAILRGIKDKYESHHGVRISDRALIAAAELSDRYITQVHGRDLTYGTHKRCMSVCMWALECAYVHV